MSVIRAQVIFNHATGLSKNRATNTWHFNGLISDPNLLTIAGKLADFYQLALPTAGGTVGSFLSSRLTNFDIRMYDVTTEPAGVPIFQQLAFSIPTRGVTTNLPSEVAACLSFQGTPEGTLVQARRRGRVYLGPLNTGAADAASGAEATIGSSFRTKILEAAQRLAVAVDPTAEWVVYSRPFAGRPYTERPGRAPLPALPARAGSTVNIDQVWIDDAFDTQRRRGVQATTKTLQNTTA